MEILRSRSDIARPPHRWATLVACIALIACAAPHAAAQPFGGFAVFPRKDDPAAYVEVADRPALNLDLTWTVELWINSRPGSSGLRWLVSKDVNDGIRLDLSGHNLQSAVDNEVFTSDPQHAIPDGEWIHVAATSDGETRRHLINGEVVSEFEEPDDLENKSEEDGASLYLGHGSFPAPPDVWMDEVRLWDVARTPQQIRDTMHMALTSPQPGLVGVWPLDGDGDDAVGDLDGVVRNGLQFADGGGGGNTDPCVPSDTTLCFRDGRFEVRVDWMKPNGETGSAKVVPGVASDDSGLLYFFRQNNWEMLIKVLDGCPVTDHFWVFFAATTNVRFDVTVRDSDTGMLSSYTNPQGQPADAVTDTGAFPCL